jgi:hypothetical protein
MSTEIAWRKGMQIRKSDSLTNLNSLEPKNEQKSETSTKQINTGVGRAQDSFESTSSTADSTTSRPGDGNSPVITDTTSSNSPNDPTATSNVLSDVAASYNQMESSVETMFSKLMEKAKNERISPTISSKDDRRQIKPND